MRMPFARSSFALLLAASFAAFTAPAAAQQDDMGGAAPPVVARLSVVEGTVALKHGDAGDQVGAVVNAPIQAGDYLSTGADGRVEVQLDANTIVRAGANTQLRFTQLDGSGEIAQLAEGSLQVRVLASSQGNVQIQTPSVDVEPSEAGSYLVSVTGDGNSEITAREGSIAVVTPQGTQDVDPGKTMLVTGQAANPQYQYVDEVAVSDLESWGDQRDQSMVVADDAQAQDVPSGMTGTSDLNQYGNWVDIPGYGQAWVPSDQAPGWTPYSSGQWVTLNYYGPTFVAAVPWGWAPYHYGSWFFTAGVGWAWTPGPRYVRPVWAPRVTTVGIGVGAGFGVRPQRAFYPSYAVQRQYAAPRQFAPRQRMYAPQRQYAAQQRGYYAPQRGYYAPQRGYYAPQRGYYAPQRAYVQRYAAPRGGGYQQFSRGGAASRMTSGGRPRGPGRP